MILQSIKDVHRKKMNRLMDKLRVVFHKKTRYKMVTFNSKNILSVKNRLGFITKVQGRP